MKIINKCKECDSTNMYVKITTNECVCRRCGNIQKIERRSKKDE